MLSKRSKNSDIFFKNIWYTAIRTFVDNALTLETTSISILMPVQMQVNKADKSKI